MATPQHGQQPSTVRDADKLGIREQRQQAALKIVRDVYEGTLRMREESTRYLPQWPLEEAYDYQQRVDQAVLLNGVATTARGLVGLVYRKDLTIAQELDDQVKRQLEDVDLQGTSVNSFCKNVLMNQILDGYTCIFVDMQRTTGQFRSVAEERRAGIRPYWINVLKGNVLRTSTAVVDGREIVTRFAFRTCTVEDVGEFDQREVIRVRDYRVVPLRRGGDNAATLGVVYSVYRLNDKNEWDVEARNVPLLINRDTPYPEIPVAVLYAGHRKGPFELNSPLLDLALENILHYQVRSDRMTVMHTACVPLLVFTGVDPKQSIAIGPGRAIKLPHPQAGASYVEPTGAALAETRQELRDSEGRMAALGLRLLQRETRQAETAEAHRIDKAESDSMLATIATEHEAGVRAAVRFQYMWLGVPPEEATERAKNAITVNRDFIAEALSPSQVAELRSMVRERQLSLETLWDLLVQGEWLPDSFDKERERERIRLDMADELTALATAEVNGRRRRELENGQRNGRQPGGTGEPGRGEPAGVGAGAQNGSET